MWEHMKAQIPRPRQFQLFEAGVPLTRKQLMWPWENVEMH